MHHLTVGRDRLAVACPAAKVTVVGDSPDSLSGTLVDVAANACCTSTVTATTENADVPGFFGPLTTGK